MRGAFRTSAPVLLFYLAGSLRGQTLLNQIRQRAADNLARQPNYTCLETIERTSSRNNAVLMRDTLRIEVALVANKPMFSWPNSKEFEPIDVNQNQLAGSSMFGNGSFALYARMVFLSGATKFADPGQETANEKKQLKYEFSADRALSSFHLQAGGREGVVGYRGFFYADPDTFDLVRLEFHGEDIPADSPLESVSERVDYSRIQFSDEVFLLPVRAETQVTASGVTDHNVGVFSACRKFVGKSTFIVGDAEDAPGSSAPAVREVSLPPNTKLQVTITSDTNLASSAVGDSIEGTLRIEVKQGKKDVLVPKGAMVRGRVLRMDHYANQTIFQITLTEIEWPGGHSSVKTVLQGFDNASYSGRDLSVRGLKKLKGVEGVWFTQ